jgi:hypothetical protein
MPGTPPGSRAHRFHGLPFPQTISEKYSGKPVRQYNKGYLQEILAGAIKQYQFRHKPRTFLTKSSFYHQNGQHAWRFIYFYYIHLFQEIDILLKIFIKCPFNFRIVNMLWNKTRLDMAENSVDHSELMKPIIRVVIALICLWVVNLVISKLPGMNAQIPGLSPWNIPVIISAVIATVMIIIVLRFGFTMTPMIEKTFPKFPELRTLAMYIIYVIILGIAYGGYRGVVDPVLVDYTWLYDIVFLAVGLFLVYIIATTFMKSTDKWTEYVFHNVKQATGDVVICPKCGASNVSNKFCNKCGFPLGK